MSLEQNSPHTTHQRPETWNDDHTLQAETVIPAPEHRDDKHDKKGMSWKTKIGLALAGIGIVGTGGTVAKSMAGGETTPTSEGNPAASATPNPGETEATTAPTEPEVMSQAEAIGEPLTDFDNLNVKPDLAVVERASEPTLVSEFNATDAVIDLMKKENVYYLSGELEPIQEGEQFETDASLAQAGAMIENLFSRGMDPALFKGASEIRKSVALRTGNFPIVYGEGEVANGETGEMEYPTWNKSRENPTLLEQTDTSATFELTSVTNTNYGAVDTGNMFDNDNIDVNSSQAIQVTIVQEDGKWVIDSNENL